MTLQAVCVCVCVCVLWVLYTCMSSAQHCPAAPFKFEPKKLTITGQCRLLAKPACRPGQATYRTNVAVAAGKSIAQKEKSLQTEILFKPFEEVRHSALC